jgi:hypothetical protein
MKTPFPLLRRGLALLLLLFLQLVDSVFETIEAIEDFAGDGQAKFIGLGRGG